MQDHVKTDKNFKKTSEQFKKFDFRSLNLFRNRFTGFKKENAGKTYLDEARIF